MRKRQRIGLPNYRRYTSFTKITIQWRPLESGCTPSYITSQLYLGILSIGSLSATLQLGYKKMAGTTSLSSPRILG
jgi:hypothetical protein